MNDELFPDSDALIERAHHSIATEIQCSVYLVGIVMDALPAPPWNTPEHFRKLGGTANLMNEAARHARNLLDKLSMLSREEKDLLAQAGAVTPQQVEHLLNVLRDDSLTLENWRKERGRLTAKNLAAHDIAEGVRRIYRRKRKPIKFGLRPDDAGPSTLFCRSVEHAIGAYGVNADWRRPARSAYDKQCDIESRLHRCVMRKAGFPS